MKNRRRKTAPKSPSPRRRRPKLHPEIIELLDDIATYCRRHDINRTNFGLALANDGHFIKRLESGRMSTLRTIDRVRQFIKPPQQEAS